MIMFWTYRINSAYTKLIVSLTLNVVLENLNLHGSNISIENGNCNVYT